jgi:hypothetical protein
MDQSDIDLLESFGWDVECKLPFEIKHTDGSFASGQAATIVLMAAKAGWFDPDQFLRHSDEG